MRETFELGSDEGLFVIRSTDGAIESAPWTGNTLVTVHPMEPETDPWSDIWIHTGEQWGPFAVTLERLTAAPQDDTSSEDVVELSLSTPGELVVTELVDHDPSMKLTSTAGTYRLRVSARGRGARPWSEDISEEPFEHYLLQLWPAPLAEPEIVRLGSEHARTELEPPDVAAEAGEDEGLAAAAAIGRDVDALPGARSLSGETGTVVVTRRIRGRRAKLFLFVAHHICWADGAGQWMFIGGGTDSYELERPAFGLALGRPGELCGAGAIRTSLVEVEKPERSVARWDWMVNPEGPVPTATNKLVPFLPESTTVTSTLTEVTDEDGGVWTDVRVEHAGLPVEWLNEMEAWRYFQLGLVGD